MSPKDTPTELLVQFDELIRCFTVILDSSCEKEFLKYVSNQELIRFKWVETVNECQRLKDKLDAANKDVSVLDSKLVSARRWLDAERQQRKRTEAERDAYANQLEEVRRILLNDPLYKLSDEAKEKLSFLSRTTSESNNVWRGTPYDRLNTIAESESLFSCLSDVSITRSDNDVDDLPKAHNASKKHRLSRAYDEQVVVKKRRSMEEARKSSPIQTELVETSDSEELNNGKLFDDDEAGYFSAVERINSRTHNFVSKTIIMPDTCVFCSKKMGFGRMVMKCVGCNAVSHPECRDKVPLPCVPNGTPTKKGCAGTISDYAPLVPPMIPAIVVHCVYEVEQRGLTEIGIYRISGTETVVRGLREKFVKGKGVANLSQVDVHSVCSCLKDFLRHLQDPLVPRAMWHAFAGAISSGGGGGCGADRQAGLRAAVQSLPPANRDTLAFICLHLQKVATSPACKMSVSNLATVFGPTVVGYSSDEHTSALAEAHTANAVMEALLELPHSFWNNFISSFVCAQQGTAGTPASVRRTPSADSLVRKRGRKLATSAATTPVSKRKFFNTSPTLDQF